MPRTCEGVPLATKSAARANVQGGAAEEDKQDVDGYQALLTQHRHLAQQLTIDWTQSCGEGAFGAVFKARWRGEARGIQIVVKVIKTPGLAHQAVRQLR